MDLQLQTDGPRKAVQAAAGTSRGTQRVDEMAADELTLLLAGDGDKQDEGNSGLFNYNIDAGDSPLNSAENSSACTNNNKGLLTILNTNARSLCPKIDSLIDCMDELDANLSVVTETWLGDGEGHDEDISELSGAAGLNMLYRNRQPNEQNGQSYGGVAVIWRQAIMDLKELKLVPSDLEILTCVGPLRGHSRKRAVVACYLPPIYSKQRADHALNCISEAVAELERRYNHPYLIVTGDFNQWRVEEILQDYVDIGEVNVGPTRGSHCIDRRFTNVSRSVRESGTVAPRETEEDVVRRSDHRVAFLQAGA